MLTAAGAAVGHGRRLRAMATAVSDRWTPLPAEIPVWAVAAALAMAVVTGMLFGLLPAVRASRLEPVAALRYE